MPDDDRTRRRLSDDTKGRIADLASGWSVDEPAAPEPKPPAKPPAATPRAPSPASKLPAKTPTPRPRGDETNARIAELASGWTVDGADTPEESPALPAVPPRKKQKTLPPPPPGSHERKALEAAIVESKTPVPASGPNRTDKKTSPPPLPPAARGKPPTQPVPAVKSAAAAKPPSLVKSGPTETGTVNVSGTIGGLTPKPLPSGAAVKTALPLRADTTDRSAPIARPAAAPVRPPVAQLLPDESGEATEVDPGAHLAVPIGEFDQPSTLLDQDKLRIAYEQSTFKRDAANALLQIPEPPITTVKEPPVEILLGETAERLKRGDPSSIDPATEKFERGDPTTLGAPDATVIDTSSSAVAAGTRLRAQAALRRKRGIGGDVRYVATVLFGVRRARRELTALEQQQAQRQKSRLRHLIVLGRTAAAADGFDHPALAKSREALADVEDERAQHAAAVTAADSELMRVRTDRAEKAKANAEGIAAIDAELADIAKKLEPLEKEVIVATKRAQELQESLRRIDAQIAATEASKVAVKGSKLDPAAIQAELATLKADRLAVERDEPRIAAELDALNPRVAALEARRAEARKRRVELDEDEKKDVGRTNELLAAIGAKRKVVDRAAADAEELRDKILLELGERIYVDRPDTMFAQLAPIEAIDVELGTTDRRMMELKEILSSVDKAKLARGITVLVLVLGAVGTLAAWLIYMLS